MKLACIFIPHFYFYIEALRRVDIRNGSTVIIKTLGSRQHVVDCSPNLGRHSPGTTLQEFLSHSETAHVIEADDTTYREQWNSLLDSLGQKSPLVEDAGIGMAYIDLQDINPIDNGDAQFAAGLERIIPVYLPAHIGIAESKFVAYLAALSADRRGAFKAPLNHFQFVSGFPIDVLPVSSSVIQRLRSFGLHTLGSISMLPLNVIQAQFPQDGKYVWDLAHGNDPSPFSPRHAEEIITETITFPDPVTDVKAMIVGVELLLQRAFARPALKGRSVRLIDLDAQIYRQPLWTTRCTFKYPVATPSQAMSRIRTVLDSPKLSGPLEEISLSLRWPTKEAARQMSLLPDVRRKEQIVSTLRQLDAVLGEQAPIFYVKEIEPWSRIPERRQVLVPVVR